MTKASGGTTAQQQPAPFTNYTWARQVLLDMGISNPTSLAVDDIAAWMPHEEPTSNWYDRNNPLNTSLGFPGSAGLNGYPSLTAGAQATADTLTGSSSYSQVVADLQKGVNPNQFGADVQNTPWASSHYEYNLPGNMSLPPSVAAPSTAGLYTGQPAGPTGAQTTGFWSDITNAAVPGSGAAESALGLSGVDNAISGFLGGIADSALKDALKALLPFLFIIGGAIIALVGLVITFRGSTNINVTAPPAPKDDDEDEGDDEKDESLPAEAEEAAEAA